MAAWKKLVIIGGFALAALAGYENAQADAASTTFGWQIDEQVAEEAIILADAYDRQVAPQLLAGLVQP